MSLLYACSRLLFASLVTGGWRVAFAWLFALSLFLAVALLLGGLPFLISRFAAPKGNSKGPSINASEFVTGIAPSGYLPAATPKPKTLSIGPYKDAMLLGTGGMGTVFKAVDPKGRTVAIKLIGGTGFKGTALMREKKKEDRRIGLVREARLAADLRHRNIVEVYDIGQNKGTLYVVMELLEGMDLDRYARRHPVSTPEALRIVAQLCDALDCAHSHGIVHRDIKPANTFITTTGVVKVLDFGLALPPEQSQAAGAVVGTYYYMSPEHIQGKPVDGRSDIWSAGVTLFQLLTSTLPFTGRTVFELRNNIVNAPTPKLPFTGPFTQELNCLVERALRKSRENRYQSAREFAADLRSVLQRLLANATEDVVQPSTGEPVNMLSQAPLPAYVPVKLGFQEHIERPVFLPDASLKKGFMDALRNEIPGIWKALIPMVWTIFTGVGLILLAVLIACGLLFVLFVVFPMAIFEAVVPPRFFKCRSCRRRMQPVSAWIRPTWLSEHGGFCERDCIAALKCGMWEEAVKLLWIHTSAENNDRRYKLEFFECRNCRDQRAYLTLEIRSDAGCRIQRSREAYRFGILQNELEFLASARSAKPSEATMRESAPTAKAPIRVSPDLHNQPTI